MPECNKHVTSVRSLTAIILIDDNEFAISNLGSCFFVQTVFHISIWSDVLPWEDFSPIILKVIWAQVQK